MPLNLVGKNLKKTFANPEGSRQTVLTHRQSHAEAGAPDGEAALQAFLNLKQFSDNEQDYDLSIGDVALAPLDTRTFQGERGGVTQSCSSCLDILFVAKCITPACPHAQCVCDPHEPETDTGGCVILPEGQTFAHFCKTFRCAQCYRRLRQPLPYELGLTGENFLNASPANQALALVYLYGVDSQFKDSVLNTTKALGSSHKHNIIHHAYKVCLNGLRTIQRNQALLNFQAALTRSPLKARTPIAIWVDTHAAPDGKITFNYGPTMAHRLGLPSSSLLSFTVPRFLEVFLGPLHQDLRTLKGLKGLFLLVCGPAIRLALDHIRRLVESRLFTFVIASESDTTTVAGVGPAYLDLYTALFLKEHRNSYPLYQQICHGLLTEKAKSAQSNFIVIYRDGHDQVHCKRFAHEHARTANAYGLRVVCPTCHNANNVLVTRNHDRRIALCSGCGFRSHVIRPSWVTQPMSGQPWFAADYPLPPTWPTISDFKSPNPPLQKGQKRGRLPSPGETQAKRACPHWQRAD
ncbi:hypothetical protein C8Q74DRAFT_1370560 [Fomes fomentarius]|nr:hypothetical protein C8Q74DRAFT_1370550 [Fomes fomentarius]KAI0767874.1 hypothetical protein C8Q74DRAFT_1370560 [Fomes fomentarius]